VQCGGSRVDEVVGRALLALPSRSLFSFHRLGYLHALARGCESDLLANAQARESAREQETERFGWFESL
jgi:hypothetical protein